jgi:hypothetical protein
MARRKIGSEGAETDGFRWKRFVAYLTSFCMLIVFGAILLGITTGMRPLESKAARLLDAGQVEVTIAWPPIGGGQPGTWLPRRDQEDLLAVARAAVGDSSELLGRTPLERIGAAIAQSGWFDGDPIVRRETGSRIAVSGRWRIPAAVVRSEGRDYLISWDAKPMPPVYSPGESNLRVIIDPAIGPPRHSDGERDFSTAWPGEDIAASLELLELVSEQPWAGQVAGVDASQYSSDGRLVLVTPQNTRVVWGGRPNRPSIGDVSTAQKLAHIAQVVQDFRRIDAGYSLIYVNSAKLQFDISASSGTP